MQILTWLWRLLANNWCATWHPFWPCVAQKCMIPVKSYYLLWHNPVYTLSITMELWWQHFKAIINIYRLDWTWSRDVMIKQAVTRCFSESMCCIQQVCATTFEKQRQTCVPDMYSICILKSVFCWIVF